MGRPAVVAKRGAGGGGLAALRELMAARRDAGGEASTAPPARVAAAPRPRAAPRATRGARGLGANLSAFLASKKPLVDHDPALLAKAAREAKAAGMDEVAGRLTRHVNLDKALAHLGGLRGAAHQLHNLAALEAATPGIKAVAARVGRAVGVKPPPPIPAHVRKASLAASAAAEVRSRGPVNAYEPIPAMRKLDALQAALQSGPRGGQYYTSATGRKVYRRG